MIKQCSSWSWPRITFEMQETVFSERARSLYAVTRPSVVCLSSVTFVHPTQPVKIFGNVPTPFDTIAITEIIPGEPLRQGS